MRRFNTIVVFFAIIVLRPLLALAWNIPTHMITGAIAQRLLEGTEPGKAAAIEAILKQHPRYTDGWRSSLEKIPESQRGEMLFMYAARWADDIRPLSPLESKARWHYINFPFKPKGEPDSIKPLPPDPNNILSAIRENERILRSEAPAEKRAVALAWLIHLIGDVHQPLHTAQLFTREYPNGDRGGNEICIRVAPNTAALDLHRLWDGLITSSTNTARLGKIATDLLTKFSRVGLREFEHKTPDAWAKESYEIATKIAYEIPGLNLTDDALRRKPNLKIELLFDPQALQKFKAAVDWVVQQIKK
jgi:S1/P1 nuclease